MKISTECRDCLSNMADQACVLATDDLALRKEARQKAEKILNRELKPGVVSIQVATPMHDVIKQVTANPDPYRSTKDIEIDEARKLFELVKDEFQNDANFTTSGLVSVLKDERKETYVRELTFDKYSVSSSWEDRFPSITTEMTLMKLAKDTVMKFVTERIEKNIQSNRREIELNDDEEKQIELMRANNEFEREKKRIKEELGS